MKTIVTFGEILMRISPAGGARFQQAFPGSASMSFGGAEANVAASLALLGAEARLVSALPDTPISHACLAFYRGLGVDTRRVLLGGSGRMGIYFYENGACQRAGQVVYDREHSTMSQTPAERYPWSEIFDEAGLLYLTGITPGVSRVAAEATLAAASEAQKRGIRIALDLNFRRKLWQWQPPTPPEELAREVLTPLIEKADLLIANEGSVLDLFAFSGCGSTSLERATAAAETLCRIFPNLSRVAMTLRESLSASHHRWGALLYDPSRKQADDAPRDGESGDFRPYDIQPVVDRVGSGDAFGAALVYALNDPALSGSADAIAFAVAASSLAHSIPGDINFATRAEVEALMRGDGSGRVIR